MSFKCSVFGHRYGDPDVEREREEQGSEVVITIKEIETCKRCGEERVVSENKEVTTLETPSDIVGDDMEEETAADQSAETESAEADPAASGVAAETDAAADEATVETTDDAEFIDEDEESDAEGDRDPGEWPDDESDAAEPASGAVDQPGHGGEAESDGPAADDDDGVILEESDEEEDASEAGREPGQWPDDAEEDEEDDQWAPSTEQDLRPVEEEQPDVEPTSSAVTVPEGEFYCPECDFTTDVESSSLREGDFCPECHRGSLAHRADAE